MTESDWLSSADPAAMLYYLRGSPPSQPARTSDRKLHLFVEACRERFESSTAWDREVPLHAPRFWATEPSEPATKAALLRDIFGNPWRPVVLPRDRVWLETPLRQEIDIFGHTRVVAPPSSGRWISHSCSWLTWHDGLIPALARQMYDSRDFSDMPKLADALEDAGCTDEDILRHCRGFEIRYFRRNMGPYDFDLKPKWVKSDAPHARGCWVVDLLPGKE